MGGFKKSSINLRNSKLSQVATEYLILMTFVTFAVLSILLVAFFYGSSIRDSIRMTQLSNFANKLVSTAESVFYSGEPSRATITAYLPEGVSEINLTDNDLIFSIQTSTGITRISFTSNVPVCGSIGMESGLKKIKIIAEQSNVNLTQI